MAKNMYQKREERKNKKMNEDGKSFSNVSINWYPGHMAKTKRQISEVISLIDVVIEVLDSRMPISSKVQDIDNITKDKKRILVFSKYDLCDKAKTDKIIQDYELRAYTTIKCDLINDNVSKKIISVVSSFMEELNLKRKNKGMLEKKAKVLVVGVPNVGKSTLINKIVGKKSAEVANKPGVTKHLNTIKINNSVDLVDTPGILWPRIDSSVQAYNLAVFGSIKEDILPLSEVVLYILNTLEKYYPDMLFDLFNVKSIDKNNIIDLYDTIGKKLNIKEVDGEANYDKIDLYIYNLIKSGKLKGITFDNIV